MLEKDIRVSWFERIEVGLTDSVSWANRAGRSLSSLNRDRSAAVPPALKSKFLSTSPMPTDYWQPLLQDLSKRRVSLGEQTTSSKPEHVLFQNCDHRQDSASELHRGQ